MLRDLLYREWLLNRLHLLIVLAMVAAFEIYFLLNVDSQRMWLVFTGVFMAFQTIVPFTREDKFQSAGWVLTLPVRREQVVRARWAGAWLLVLAGLLMSTVVGLLLPGSQLVLSQALIPDTVLLAAAIVSIILVLLLPFTIRFGLTGVLIFMVAAQILGAALLVVAVMGGGRRSLGQGLHALIEGTRGALLGIQAAMTPTVFHVAALAALVLLNWLGYRFALALYRRREF
jgi:hypothetical protein